MTDGNETIAVTHGFGGHRWVLHPLCRNLRRFSYGIKNWGYRSLWKDVPSHAANFRTVLEELEQDPHISRFHIVAHSMGSILTRVAMQGFSPAKLGRIVMICPPNRGSHVAAFYAPLFGWLSTTLTQISDADNSFVNRLQAEIDSQYEVGIVRAQTDFVVQQENTRLPEAKDYIQLRGFHSSVVFHQHTAEQVHHFLQHGEFKP